MGQPCPPAVMQELGHDDQHHETGPDRGDGGVAQTAQNQIGAFLSRAGVRVDARRPSAQPPKRRENVGADNQIGDSGDVGDLLGREISEAGDDAFNKDGKTARGEQGQGEDNRGGREQGVPPAGPGDHTA